MKLGFLYTRGMPSRFSIVKENLFWLPLFKTARSDPVEYKRIFTKIIY